MSRFTSCSSYDDPKRFGSQTRPDKASRCRPFTAPMTFSIACRYCRRDLLKDVPRIDEQHVMTLREHVLVCGQAPAVASRQEVSSLSLDRLRDLGVLLKHFDVRTDRA